MLCPHCGGPLDPDPAVFDDEFHAVIANGVATRLWRKRWEILSLFRRHFGRPVHHDTIYEVIWPGTAICPGAVKVAICAINHALEGTGMRIHPIYGFGYIMDYRESAFARGKS